MRPTVLDGLLERQRALTDFLRSHEELSIALDAELTFKKLFVVACGSYFEQGIVAVVEHFADRGDPRLKTFVKKRALERRYHDMFDWSVRNANRFFSFFGNDFSEQMRGLLQNDQGLQDAMGAFMELGALRNVVAHDFASSSVDKTVDELAALYVAALDFLNFVRVRLEGGVPVAAGGNIP